MTEKILRPSKKSNHLIRDVDILQQRRDDVARAAFDLFLKDGFHRTKTRDIARRAGVSAGAVFTYFKDKEDILVHIVSREQQRVEEQLLQVLARLIQDASHTEADPEVVFSRVFGTFLRMVDETGRFILLAYQETKSLNMEGRQALMAHEKHLQALLSEAIRYGVEQGRFAPDNVELKAHNIAILAHAWAIRRWAFTGIVQSIDDYIALLLPQVLAMLEQGAAINVTAPKRERRRTAGAAHLNQQNGESR
jgi:TetR/AcrR family transcriptional regulator, cholesterol catabolism regulator